MQGLSTLYYTAITFLQGLSTLYYTARYMNLLSTASNLTQYREKRDQICAQSWDQVYQLIFLCYRSFCFSWVFMVCICCLFCCFDRVLSKPFTTIISEMLFFCESGMTKCQVSWIRFKKPFVRWKTNLDFLSTLELFNFSYVLFFGMTKCFKFIVNELLKESFRPMNNKSHLFFTLDRERQICLPQMFWCFIYLLGFN